METSKNNNVISNLDGLIPWTKIRGGQKYLEVHRSLLQKIDTPKPAQSTRSS